MAERAVTSDGYDEAGNLIKPPLASAELRWDGRTRCRICRRPVIWVLTLVNNRKMCVDAAPADDGTIEVLRVTFGDPVVKVHGTPPPEGHQRYRVHRPSCQPQPRGWRRRQKEKTDAPNRRG